MLVDCPTWSMMLRLKQQVAVQLLCGRPWPHLCMTAVITGCRDSVTSICLACDNSTQLELLNPPVIAPQPPGLGVQLVITKLIGACLCAACRASHRIHRVSRL